MNKFFMKWVFSSFLSIFLVACGFHLRGNVPLSLGLSPLYIDTTTPYDPLVLDIEDTLIASHINVVESPKAANTILRIIDIKFSESLVSVSTSTNTRQYALSETLQMELIDKNGKVIIPVSTLIATNPLTVDSSQVLNTSTQKQTLTEEMQQTLVQQLMAKLSSKNTTKALEH